MLQGVYTVVFLNQSAVFTCETVGGALVWCGEMKLCTTQSCSAI